MRLPLVLLAIALLSLVGCGLCASHEAREAAPAAYSAPPPPPPPPPPTKRRGG